MTKPKNRAKCALCGDIIVSKHHYDFKACKCGEIFIDGGDDYWRAGAKDFKNLLRYENRKWTPIEFRNEVVIAPPQNFFKKVLMFWLKGK